MDKITELKWELVGECSPHETAMGFGNGFDAAIELNLPVLFLKWQINNRYQYDYSKNKFIAAWDNYSEHTYEELYDYWIENIYMPEQK